MAMHMRGTKAKAKAKGRGKRESKKRFYDKESLDRTRA